MRFISDTSHGIVDYIAAIVLIVTPFILDFHAINPIGHWLSVVTGVALFAYSLLTEYALGVKKLIPFRLHLLFDLAAGVVFLIAPFVLGFEGEMRTFYLLAGTAVLLLVLFTKSQTVHHALPATA